MFFSNRRLKGPQAAHQSGDEKFEGTGGDLFPTFLDLFRKSHQTTEDLPCLSMFHWDLPCIDESCICMIGQSHSH